jgi:hypothetical protein
MQGREERRPWMDSPAAPAPAPSPPAATDEARDSRPLAASGAHGVGAEAAEAFPVSRTAAEPVPTSLRRLARLAASRATLLALARLERRDEGATAAAAATEAATEAVAPASRVLRREAMDDTLVSRLAGTEVVAPPALTLLLLPTE